MAEAQRLILASGSSARRAMLSAAGIVFDVVPAEIDEDAIKSAMTSENDGVEAIDVARALAAEKALAVARTHPGTLVIGSDQVLVFDRQMFSKAANTSQARQTLSTLRGSTHQLVSAVALASSDAVVWQTVDSAQLTMRRFSNDFLDDYLNVNGERILSCVGCYEIEGAGVQLFERVEGDHFTIMGMPLLPLLSELRNRGVLPQ